MGHGKMRGGVGNQSADLMFLFLREIRDALIHREWGLTFQIEDLKLFIFAKTLWGVSLITEEKVYSVY